MDAYVLGRLSADLYPLQLNTPLEEVRTYERFVGGFAGNVSTGLARLGVSVAIVSAVGECTPYLFPEIASLRIR